MIELRPFTEIDFQTFINWIHSKEELFQFAGPLLTYPVTDSQLYNYLQMTDKVPLKVVFESTQKAIGHCELNFENGGHRLSRIFIGEKNLRGMKIGEQVVRKMADLLFEDKNVSQVDLNTFDSNKQAIRCYEKVGFRVNPEKKEKMIIFGTQYTKINMVLRRSKYFS